MKVNHRKDLTGILYNLANDGVPASWDISKDPTNPYAFIVSRLENVTTVDGSTVSVPKRFRVLVKEVD
jgi:hypothetical protein